MKVQVLVAAGTLVAFGSAMVAAQDAPESLLPPGFESPAPTPTPSDRPSGRPDGTGPAAPSAPAIRSAPRAGSGGERPSASTSGPAQPSIGDIVDPELLEQLIEDQQPKYDIPPFAARSLASVGVLADSEGGLPEASTAPLSGAFLQAVIDGTRGPLVSRWGEILLRRALVSRLATPAGLEGADWVALRARLLLRLGEVDAARSLVQQVDSGSYTPRLEDAAMDAYLGTGDILGLCPVIAITAAARDEPPWQMTRQICRSFRGEGSGAMAELERMRRRGIGGGYKNIDLLLAQKYAGAALESRKAVRIEWNDVEELTPWRYGLALATGLEPPPKLLNKANGRFDPIAARAPMLPLDRRAAAADHAGARGILSSAAMVDLYSQLAANDEGLPQEWTSRAGRLRDAYVAGNASDRLAAMRELWGDKSDPVRAYSRRVLTAYAAARMPVREDFAASADELVTSMLAAGLDRNAARWAGQAPTGSQAWALLVLGTPGQATIGSGALDSYAEDDRSADSRRSRFLLAGLSGLGRVDRGAATAFADDLSLNLGRQTRWTRAIDQAAASGNQVLVAFLVGAGMQGASWDKMTALHLYHIVAALRRVGLEPEARMIAAEAVARS